MKRKFRTPMILIILIILISIAIFFYFNTRDLDKNLFNKTLGKNQDSETNSGNENTKTQNNLQTTGNSNDDASDSQTSSQNTNSENSFCYNKQATYSIGNINEYYFCNSLESSSCVDKTAKCSVKVQNLDKTISGNFEIKFSFFEKENRSNIVEISSSNSFIAPNEEKILKSELVIQGNNADKNLSCYYSTTEVPKEKICY